MKNQQISKLLNNPGKMYLNMSNKELSEYLSKGYARLTKDKCYKAYNMEDFRRGILEANSRPKNNDINVHIVDLMLFALAKIEDLETTTADLETILKQIENEKIENTEMEEND